jgi:hypothetical protein
MIADHLRLVAHRGSALWHYLTNTGWQIASAQFVRYLLQAHGFSQLEAVRFMACSRAVAAEPHKLVTRLEHRGRAVAYRVSTWIGPRYGSEANVSEWLRRNGFSVNEVDSLFLIADTLPVSASESKSIRKLAEHGIRASKHAPARSRSSIGLGLERFPLGHGNAAPRLRGSVGRVLIQVAPLP